MKKILLVLFLLLSLLTYGNTLNEKFINDDDNIILNEKFDDGSDSVIEHQDKSVEYKGNSSQWKSTYGEKEVRTDETENGIIRYQSGKLEHTGSFNEGKNHAKSVTPFGEGKVTEDETGD